MARSESVVYTCDVCRRQEEAQYVTPQGGSPAWVRPKGWGSLHLNVQVSRDKKTIKRDFCSLDCLNDAYEEFVNDAYDQD